MLRSLKMKHALIGIVLIFVLLPMMLKGWWSTEMAKEALLKQRYAQLESIRDIKIQSVQRYFQERRNNMQTLLRSLSEMEAQGALKLQTSQNLKKAHLESRFKMMQKNLNAITKHPFITQVFTQVSGLHAKKHASSNDYKTALQRLDEKQGFSKKLTDLTQDYWKEALLIHKDGDLIYSMNQQFLGKTNFLQGKHKKFALSKALLQVQKKGKSNIALADFDFYPHFQSSTLFLVTRVTDAKGSLLGFFAVGINSEEIDRIVQESSGMGQTGESYLVGKSDTRSGYRSTRRVKRGSIGDPKSGKGADLALSGKSGYRIKMGSTGNLEMEVYAPLAIEGLHWGIITTISYEEIVAPKSKKNRSDFYAQFVAQYGYQDLFLITPKGLVFYTVQHQPEYKSNLRNNVSLFPHLNKVFEDALSQKKMILSDIVLYSSIRNVPSFFIAQPQILHGEVKMIVVVRSSIKELNGIMQERHGMGVTGETYLVGKDMRMRSDSFLDPLKHSVQASLEGSIETSGVRSKASREALSGTTGSMMAQDYRDISVLSAYAPIEFEDFRWALLAEIDTAEAVKPANKLMISIMFLTLVIGCLIFLVLLGVLNRIMKIIGGEPEEIMLLAEQVSYGKTEFRGYDVSDRATGIHGSLQKIIVSFQNMTQQAQSMAQGDYQSIQIALRSSEDSLGKSLKTMHQTLQETVDLIHHIAQGEYGKRLKMRSSQDQLAQAINPMIQRLEESMEQNRSQNWFKDMRNRFHEIMRGQLDEKELGQKLLDFLTRNMGASLGALYNFDSDSKTLRLIATHGFSNDDIPEHKMSVRSGLAGQAAFERQVLYQERVPQDYTRIHSATGSSRPSSIIALPFLYENKLMGVLEMASFETISPLKQELLHTLMESLGSVFHSVSAHKSLQKLLSETQSQSEELQAQSEELQSQSEELQVQQEELRVSNDALEGKNLVLEIQRQDLEEAQTQAQEQMQELQKISEYKSEFLANMSHELRTPLNSILLLSHSLMENRSHNLTERQIESAKIVHKSGQDLLYLIDDVLDLSKIEAGMISIEFKEVHTQNMVQALKQNFVDSAHNKGIELEFKIHSNFPETFVSDGVRLEQILRNLISNAIKFTEQGRVQVHFQAVQENSPEESHEMHPLLEISVSDTGIGIAPKKQESIFAAFQQEDGSTVRKYGGTGLGLSISKELASLLGGEIHLKSEQGKGSTFSFRFLQMELPASISESENAQLSAEISQLAEHSPESSVKKESEDSQEQDPSSKESLYRGEEQLKGCTILLVDDDMRNVFALSHILQDHGMETLIADSGERALQVLDEQGNIDLVLMDIMMPVMDGFEAMKRIREQEKHKDLPIIALTAKAQPQVREECLAAGANDYHCKPVNMEQLLSLMKVFLYH